MTPSDADASRGSDDLAATQQWRAFLDPHEPQASPSDEPVDPPESVLVSSLSHSPVPDGPDDATQVFSLDAPAVSGAEDTSSAGKPRLIAGRYRLEEQLVERRQSLTWRAFDTEKRFAGSTVRAGLN